VILKECLEKGKRGKFQGGGGENARLAQLAVGMDGDTQPWSEDKEIPEGGGVEKQSKEDVVRYKKFCCVSVHVCLVGFFFP